MTKTALVLMYREHAADFRAAAVRAETDNKILVDGLRRKADEYDLCAQKLSEMEDE